MSQEEWVERKKRVRWLCGDVQIAWRKDGRVVRPIHGQAASFLLGPSPAGHQHVHGGMQTITSWPGIAISISILKAVKPLPA